MAGLFITFEGGEGAGKSTQINRTAAWLEQRGHQTVTTREPGGAEGAEKIRELLVSGHAAAWEDLTECLLMNAARAEHLNKTIRPALADGRVVLCDRFMDSTRAYQGGAGGIDMATLRQVEALVVGETQPDLTLIFDLPVRIGLKRAAERGGADRFEKKGTTYHEKVRQTFLEIAHSEPERCQLVNADQSMDQVSDDVLTSLQSRLKLGKS